METKIVFVGGAEIRIHEEIGSVRDKFVGERDWVKLDKPGTKRTSVWVNPASVAYLEEVQELEPGI